MAAGSEMKRTALVIGNGAYKVKTGTLNNPENDANDMAVTLQKLGFKVEKLVDIGQQQMEEAIKDFGTRLKKGGVGLFYFAGHGIQVEERNYLIPVDAKLDKESDVKYKAVDAGQVMDEMDEAKNELNIVILDACRDNPFARSWKRSGQGGLALMDSPTGTLIVYSTSPGKTAADGIGGRNGIFTKHLIRHMIEPGLEIEDVIKKVRVDVATETGKKQVPWAHSSLMGNFYFADSGGAVIVTPPPVEPSVPTAPPPSKEGKLTVTANVSGAKVQINNGSETWKVPVTMKITEAGEYRIKVTASGYKPFEKREYIELGAVVEVPVYLEKEEQTTKTLGNSLGMSFVYIPPGKFMMGSPKDELGRYDDEILHEVRISKGFYMQTTEVTQGQWKSVMGNNPSSFKDCGDKCPVENVSWNDVHEFIKKLNQKGEGTYRLPTEAEWEYAARAGTERAFFWGNQADCARANYGNSDYSSECKGQNPGKTMSVMSFNPNAWGLHDMHGNVWEWCEDWYGDYPSGSVNDPVGPSSGSIRVRRGGSWFDGAQYCRSAYRGNFAPGIRHGGLGFRLLRSLP
jgi:formylglycine-generating enzyme required for sulfatase activity